MSTVGPQLCPCCGKICHPTRGLALLMARRDSRGQIRLRAYQCPAGQGWHLTSRRPPGKRRPARERARRYAQIRARRTQRPAPPETLAAGKRGETNTLP